MYKVKNWDNQCSHYYFIVCLVNRGTHCNLNQKEDEIHFLIGCELCTDIILIIFVSV